MKAIFVEHDGCFAVELEAETMLDAAALTRFGMNRREKLNYCAAHVDKSGAFTASIIFAKNKNAQADVPKRK